MTIATRKGSALAAVASIALLSLSACNDGDNIETAETTEEIEPGSQSVAAMIAGDGDLSTVESLMEDAGLAAAFDAAPEYTVFAPTDSALGSLGADFEGEEGRAAMIAILREHIVPGYLTREDIVSAVEGGGGSVEMATMGNGTLTFSMEGDALTVTGSDGGASAPVDAVMLGSNGVVVPVSSVLKDTTPVG